MVFNTLPLVHLLVYKRSLQVHLKQMEVKITHDYGWQCIMKQILESFLYEST